MYNTFKAHIPYFRYVHGMSYARPIHCTHSMSGRAKHAAQSIRHMWMREGERLDPKLHTMNRYGVQMGDKVP